jgi:diguanylate cyclase (GGDEF)-like protein
LPIGIVTACEDISDRKKAEAEIHRLAYYDPLTDLPNRMLFNDRLSYMLAQAERYKRQGALLFLDVDRFKAINESLGHAMGDLLLKILAERLTDAIRHTDIITRREKNDPTETLARFGGDEFIIWLAEIEESQDVIKVAKRILETFEKPFSLDKHDVRVTASMGIAIFPGDGRNREVLFKNAAAAMYHAKAKGGDNYQFYSNSMNSAALAMLTMESALQKAIEKGELLLYYQPQIDLESGKITGAEALLRWRREEESLLSPGQFIPLAEKSGLIVQIGEWVLRKVCMQCKEWQTAGLPPLRLSVNLSSRQFWQKQLALTVSSILEEYDLDPSCLGLEITENILMKEDDSTIDALNGLKKLGVHLLIDDFGTGYSSLNYLKRFPLDYLKIDKCFIKELDNSPEDVAIVSAIIAMANSLNLKVIAEGIETYSQLDFLRERGCDEIQGFLVSEPLPPENFIQLMEQGGEILSQISNF